MSLQVTYRPDCFGNFFGNPAIIKSLSSVLERKKPPSAFLITGPGGTGKTTLSRIIKDVLKCSDVDFKEINASDERKIDDVRALRDSLKFAPLDGNKKVIVFDEAHSLTPASQEAILKMLEEPPEYVHFILCTTNPEALKFTLKRRCHQYELMPLPDLKMGELIKYVLKGEKVKLKKFPKAIVDKIIEIADGSAGQALKLLDMVIDMDSKEDALQTLSRVTVSEKSPEVIELCRILSDEKINDKTRWKKLAALLKEFQNDGESARRPILGYLSKVLLSSGNERIAFIIDCFKSNYYDSGKAGLVYSCFMACTYEE